VAPRAANAACRTVIGYADPGQNPSAVRSGSYRVRERALGTRGHGLIRGRRLDGGDEHQGVEADTDERPPGTPDLHGQEARDTAEVANESERIRMPVRISTGPNGGSHS
jgi:hypothetical protein